MKKLLLYIVLCSLLTSCNENATKNEEDVVVIRLDENSEDVDVCDIPNFISDTKIVQLSSKVIIGEINQICSLDTFLYILDGTQRSVHVFSFSGKYISSISRLGHGPGEYISLRSIFVDENTSTVNLVSSSDMKLLTFDKTGKNLIKEKKFSKYFSFIQKIQNGYVGYIGSGSDPSNPNIFWIMDDDMNIKSQGVEKMRVWGNIIVEIFSQSQCMIINAISRQT